MTADPERPSADLALATLRGRLDHQRAAEVRRIIEAATEVDGVRPLSEHVTLHLRYGGEVPTRNVLLWAGEGGEQRLAAYAHLDVTDPVEGPSAELVVDPAYRDRGYARRLVQRLLEESPDGRLRLWAHGGHPGAARLADVMGFESTRELWQMRRSLFAPLPQAPVPAGVAVRTFEAGHDDQEWVRVNARAFAGHPEQGEMTVRDLHRRMAEPWFEPAGFFLAERSGRLVGFHWTKIHGGDGDRPHGHEPIGEVYVVGVDPDEQGTGLGRALTVIGLRHLRARGLPQAMLYVEATNAAAIGLYKSLGFTHWETDVMYRHDPMRRGQGDAP
ncbi:MAG: mycothiol synthase [Carbonactinosporaceae bacterium]